MVESRSAVSLSPKSRFSLNRGNSFDGSGEMGNSSGMSRYERRLVRIKSPCCKCELCNRSQLY